jgi:hypothetical protein
VEDHRVESFAIDTGGHLPEVHTGLTISISRTTAWYGRYGAPILSGLATPDPDMVGQIMHVNVKKPNRATWTYSSNRTIYASSTSGKAEWWYRYTFLAGMPRGTYYFRAFYDGNATLALPPASTGPVSCRL